MLIVSNEAVRFFCPWAAPTGIPQTEGIQLLEYLSNLYEPVERFPLSQKQEAEQRWAALTDNTEQIYLLLAETDTYSLWCLHNHCGQELDFTPIATPRSRSEAVRGEQLVNWLLQSFWLVITDLAGNERSRIFGQEVLASTIPIHSATELQQRLEVVAEPVDAQTFQRGQTVSLEFQTLAARHLGREAVALIFAELERKVALVPLPTPTSFEAIF